MFEAERILQIVSTFYQLSIDEIRLKKRKRGLVKARQMVCILSDDNPVNIASALNFARCNTYWSCKSIIRDIRTNEKIRLEYRTLKKLVYETKR
jgi:chromosomal replication initiation ATPase DnaA